MSDATVLEAADNLAALIHRVAADKERVVLAGDNHETAALVPVEDLKLIEQLEDRADLNDALKALSDETGAESGPSIPWEQVKKDLGL